MSALLLRSERRFGAGGARSAEREHVARTGRREDMSTARAVASGEGICSW